MKLYSKVGEKMIFMFMRHLYRPASGAGAKGLFGAGADMAIARAGANGVLMLAGWGGLGILLMRVGCGWEWVVTKAG
jgi:hypothetical protein